MKRNDLLLGAFVLIFALLLYCIISLLNGAGKYAVAYQGRQEIKAFPLSKDAEETFYSPEGGNNTLVIENGEAYVKDADCPDGLCMKQGRISKAGQTLICLPHEFSVIIEDGR